MFYCIFFNGGGAAGSASNCEKLVGVLAVALVAVAAIEGLRNRTRSWCLWKCIEQ